MKILSSKIKRKINPALYKNEKYFNYFLKKKKIFYFILDKKLIYSKLKYLQIQIFTFLIH